MSYSTRLFAPDCLDDEHQGNREYLIVFAGGNEALLEVLTLFLRQNALAHQHLSHAFQLDPIFILSGKDRPF